MDEKVIEIMYEGHSMKVKDYGTHYCGYVKLVESDRYFNVNYNDIPIQCHGGLTYGEVENNGYWIGFDCMHANDTKEIQNVQFVVNECISIIHQIDILNAEKEHGIDELIKYVRGSYHYDYGDGSNEIKSIKSEIITLLRESE